MRFVFFKHQLTWPRQAGHDVHSAEMMRALAAKGHSVVFLSRTPPDAGCDRRPRSGGCRALVTPMPRDASVQTARGCRRRFFSYWGIDPGYAAAVARACRRYQADVLVVGGPRCAAVPGRATPCGARLVRRRRVGAASPQSVRLLRSLDLDQRAAGGGKGRLPAGIRRSVDRMWVVTDRRSLGGAAGLPASADVDVMPNGVDTRLLQPEAGRGAAEHRGVLGPTRFRAERSGARVVRAARSGLRSASRGRTQSLRIIGFKPGEEVRRLAARAGRHARRQTCADLRDEVCRHAVAIAPMVSGLGHQEQAARGRGDGSRRSCARRRRRSASTCHASAPMVDRDRPAEWASDTARAVGRSAKRASLGADARRWVTEPPFLVNCGGPRATRRRGRRDRRQLAR